MAAAGRRGKGITSADAFAESPRYMWLMGALLFGSGATIGAGSLIVPHPESFNDTALWQNIALSYAGTLACLVAAPRLHPFWIYPLIAIGIAAVSRAAYFSGEPSGFYTLFYVWIGFYAVFFFSLRAALLTLTGIALAYAIVLLQLDATAAIARWITTIGTVALGAFLIDTLVRRVRGVARQSAEIASERAQLMATLAQVARTDDLTGLPNRRAWDEALDRELARAKRQSTPLCVGLADLDRFKRYNDDFGHQAGDRLLKQTGGVWGAQLRATDVLARYGGEEFALAFPACEPAGAEILVERLRASTPQGQTCSVGLVLWDGRETAESLFGRADRALYVAKDSGRDRVIFA